MSYAIIDAAAGDGHGSGGAERSRYSTPIANVPLIYHVFDELAASGVDRVRVVSSSAVREELEQVLDGGRTWGVDVSYADVQGSDSHVALLGAIQQVVSDEPVLVYPGDCLFPSQIAAMWERFSAGDVDVVVLGTTVATMRRNPGTAAAPATSACSVPAIVGSAAGPLISELRNSDTSEEPDLVARLLTSDCRVGVCELGGHWRYSDATDDLLAANRMLLDVLPVPSVSGTFDQNEVRGRVAISPSARVSGCTLYGPIAIGERAVVEDSFIGPYTAIGSGAVVMGAEVDNTMVLAGGEIRHPGQRIEASIIGERASVLRSFTLPKGLHVRLGPDARVTLS